VNVLGIVTIVSFVCSVVGSGLLIVLAISLRTQGNDTNKQVWNRRMLTGGSLTYAIGLLLPFLLLRVGNASAVAIGVLILGFLVAGLVVIGRLRRVLAVLCFVAAALVIGLAPHLTRDSLYDAAALLGGGFLLTVVSRVIDGYVERERSRHSTSLGSDRI
jgi:hypothetical protein